MIFPIVYITLSAKVDIIDCYSKPHLFFILLHWAGEDLSLICLYSNSSGRVIQKMRAHWLESFDLTGIWKESCDQVCFFFLLLLRWSTQVHFGRPFIPRFASVSLKAGQSLFQEGKHNLFTCFKLVLVCYLIKLQSIFFLCT